MSLEKNVFRSASAMRPFPAIKQTSQEMISVPLDSYIVASNACGAPHTARQRLTAKPGTAVFSLLGSIPNPLKRTMCGCAICNRLIIKTRIFFICYPLTSPLLLTRASSIYYLSGKLCISECDRHIVIHGTIFAAYRYNTICTIKNSYQSPPARR